MTKPPTPDNLITDFMNRAFSGNPDSLLSMVMINFALAGLYLVAAALIRRARGSSGPKGRDLAFALTVATPVTSLIVLGTGGLPGALIVAGVALVIGLYLSITARNDRNYNRETATSRNH